MNYLFDYISYNTTIL